MVWRNLIYGAQEVQYTRLKKPVKNVVTREGVFVWGSVGQVLLVITELLVEVGVIQSSSASYWAVVASTIIFVVRVQSENDKKSAK
jgi:hypothetical protein